MNRLLAFGGILAVVGGFALLMMPTGHIPLLDAKRQVLAESERAGYCAGVAYVQSQGRGSHEAMAECMATSTVANDFNLERVQPAFCRGIIEKGLSIAQGECEAIMAERKYWPTAGGGLTDAWNRRFPYPLDDLGVPTPRPDDYRGGERVGNDREGSTR